MQTIHTFLEFWKTEHASCMCNVQAISGERGMTHPLTHLKYSFFSVHAGTARGAAEMQIAGLTGTERLHDSGGKAAASTLHIFSIVSRGFFLYD
jgi:hypothetical protein